VASAARIRTGVRKQPRRKATPWDSSTSARQACTPNTRDDNGELRQKRGDTLVGNIEREYGVDFGVRSDMRLDTLRDQTGLTSIEDLLRNARRQG
jgi:hypothetical protein